MSKLIPEELLAVVQKALSGIAVAGKNAKQSALRTIERLFEILAKGKRAILEFFEQAVEKIVAWFMTNKEKFSKLVKYGKPLLERIAKTYAKRYPEGKLYKILNLRQAYRLYGNLGKIIVKEVDVAFEIIIKSKGYKERVMISGMLYKGDTAKKVFTSVNFTLEELRLGKLADFIESMHPVLKKRYELHLNEMKKGLKASSEMIKKAGIAASHGEIRALNQLLYYLE